MSNIKNYKNNNNNSSNECNNINNESLYEIPVTPHQSLGDLNNVDKDIMDNNSKYPDINVNSGCY